MAEKPSLERPSSASTSRMSELTPSPGSSVAISANGFRFKPLLAHSLLQGSAPRVLSWSQASGTNAFKLSILQAPAKIQIPETGV